jgi:hypothetical protein
MLAPPNVLDFVSDELARRRAGWFTSAQIGFGPFDGSLLRHGVSMRPRPRLAR